MDILKPQSRRELYKEADAIYDLLSVRKYEGREVNSLIDESENTGDCMDNDSNFIAMENEATKGWKSVKPQENEEDFWKGEFGDNYTTRNRVNWLNRIPFWTSILAEVGVKSVLEIGCNVGWNLLALRAIDPGVFCSDLNLQGVEINKYARTQAKHLGLNVTHGFKNLPSGFDLVFTSGLLIHIENPSTMMENIIKASSQYVLAIEYFSEQAQEIEYRGHKGKLWKRNYGKMYEEAGLRLIQTGDAAGFDQCKYWLLSK